MKTHREGKGGCGGGKAEVYLCSFFNLNVTWGWVVNPMLEFALPQVITFYPFYRRLGGPQSHLGWVQKITPIRI